MKHSDFTSLEIDDVLTRVLTYCQQQTKSSAVHWISTFGLDRIYEATEDDWQWTFTAADVVGKHMWSLPAGDLFQLFQMWKTVSQLYTRPYKGNFPPHFLSLPHPRFVYPVFFGEHLIGVLTFDRPKEASPVAIVNSFREGLEVASKYLHFAYVHMDARNLSYLDELTGLYNQRYLPMAIEHEVQRAKREGNPFTLLFLDIDFFKMVNDGRGHWVGSRLLVELGQVLKAQVRSCDYCFRYGGDEFIVILGNSDVDGSRRVAERIRQAIEKNNFVVEGHTLKLTVSIGLAAYPEHAQSASGLIQLADQAMYDGKRKSRNIVFVAS